MKTDLLIIGGGLAGLTAAYEELKTEPGRRITILRPGAGSSPYVHGFNMPLNPQDSTELFIQDTEASGRGQGNAALVEELCRGSLELLPFFDELGLDFNREADGSYQQLRPLGASCPRVISIGNDAGGAKKAQTVFANVTAGVSQNRVSVVLQHDIHDFSVDAVEDIIVWGLNNGYSFERLTENSPGVHHGVQN